VTVGQWAGGPRPTRDRADLARALAVRGGRGRFSRLELVATPSGEPLYGAYGFTPLERIEVSVGAIAVPAVRMEKHVNPNLLG
jgi:hypothetical protein